MLNSAKITIETNGSFIDEIAHKDILIERLKAELDQERNENIRLEHKLNAVRKACMDECLGNIYASIGVKTLAKAARDPVDLWAGEDDEE